MCKKCERNKLQKNTCEVADEIYPLTQQKLVRPHISYARVLLCVSSALLLIGALVWATLWGVAKCEWYRSIEMTYNTQFILLYIIFLFVTMFIFAKHIIIFLIRLYQRYMPYDIRCNCLFVPNCSEYMILAIEKYGVCKGVRKGINRLLRCHEPNGGVDYP